MSALLLYTCQQMLYDEWRFEDWQIIRDEIAVALFCARIERKNQGGSFTIIKANQYLKSTHVRTGGILWNGWND